MMKFSTQKMIGEIATKSKRLQEPNGLQLSKKASPKNIRDPSQ